MVNQDNKPGNTVLDSFSKLTNSHESVRIKSATDLLKHLTENGEDAKDGREINYALKRLIRGLGASTSTARIGYFTTLTVWLNLLDNVDIQTILQFVESELHKSGKNSDSENADICIGQILTCGALIRSNLWYNFNNDNRRKVIDTFVGVSKERSYLGIVGFSFLVQLLDQLNENEVEKTIMPLVKSEIEKPWSEQTTDTLYLLLKLQEKCPRLGNKKMFRNTLGSPEFVCEESIEPLCNILMKIPRVTSIEHPIYNEIVKKVPPNKIQIFFEELDKHLKTPNRNKLLIFIKILSNMCTYISSQDVEHFKQIPEIFTQNFIKQMLAYFKLLSGPKRDKQFCDSVHRLFEVLLNTLKVDKVEAKTKIAVLKKFLFKPGTFIFEKRTKSKIVQQITATLDQEGVKSLALMYRAVIEGKERLDSDELWLNMDRLYSAHLFIKLLNHHSMKIENDWKVEQLSFLMTVSLFRDINGISIGRELADSLKNAFFGALDLKLPKLEDLQDILFHLNENLNSKLNPENLSTDLRSPITLQHFELWQKTLAIIHKLEKKKKKGLKSVFLTLFLHMNLQLFNDVELATDSLNELHSCYKRLKADKLNKTTEEDGQDPLWIEVVVDLFLNLLSHNSHLLRNLIKCVFPHLCEYMTSTTIHQVVSVLDPKNEDPLSKNYNDSDSEDEDGDTDHSGIESDGGEEEEAEDDIAEVTSNEKLRMALHQALSEGKQSDDESVDLDEITDEQGEKLDQALANVFKQFKPNHGRRKKQTKDEESLTHFRVRVLDLVEIYLESNPPMLLTLQIMLPLLQAVEFSIRNNHQTPLKDRLNAVLKKLVGLKKFSNTEGVTGQILLDLLKSLLEKGTKNVIIIQDMGEQISDCCVFVVKCAEVLRNTEGVPKKVKKLIKRDILEVLSGELHNFFTRRDCLTPYVLFKSLLQLCWVGNVGLVSILFQFLFSEEVKQFKKTQAAELIKIFYSNNRFLKENAEKIQNQLCEDHNTFSQKITEYFRDLCDNSEKKQVKERFIYNLFHLMNAMKQCPLNIGIEWDSIAQVIREYRSYKTFSKDAKSAFNKLCSSLHVSKVVKMKNKPITVPEMDISKENEIMKIEKKKQKKANKEKLKLKKEAKMFRLESLSHGLTSSVNFSEAQEVDRDSDSEHQLELKKKKRKNKIVKEDNSILIKMTNGAGSDIETIPNKKQKVRH
ncbi:uncharacterized protein LOC132706596 [Cylas formicarius]|uniref:uncharacterized protein LOC132706596 n=1 Tax=Cylas formicarius TaxID=197179 RepID=UPI0029584F71|nr:uncharacterized protein LOC132706596 [Cylas formicarius]